MAEPSRSNVSTLSGLSSFLTDAPRRSLRRQLTWRLFGVFLLVALLGSATLFVLYQSLMVRTQRDAADDALRYVASSYQRQRAAWERDATELKTQIDFMRVFGDGRTDSWLRLRAYFATLEGKVGKFPAGVVLRRDGTQALAFGNDSAVLAAR